MAKENVLRMRVSEDEKRAFEEAASLAGISFSAWSRMTLRRAALRQFEEAGKRLDFQPRSRVKHDDSAEV